MPFANQPCLVSGVLQLDWILRRRVGDASVQTANTVLVAELAGQDRGAARRADRVAAHKIVKPHALIGQTVYRRSFNYRLKHDLSRENTDPKNPHAQRQGR